MSSRMKLEGQKFGSLTVLELGFMQNGYSYWLCECECGNKKNCVWQKLKIWRYKKLRMLNKRGSKKKDGKVMKK